MKKIAILGSTGSIGTQTLDIVRGNDDLEVVAISAGSNIELLEKQAREFKPELIAVYDEQAAKRLKENISDLSDIKVVSGMEGLIEIAVYDKSSVLVTAIVGMIGILPTIEAIKAGKDIALANKETLVTAGHIIMPLAKEYNVNILPVDSEHSAIFQSMNGENKKRVSKLLITASGGPFRTWEKDKFPEIRLEDALKHPNWVMGQKITIDSATMVNKGLEVMEAKWLFGVELDNIEVVVHPQSVIHSMVEYADGAIIAQLGTPDMKIPIQYALYYPDRKPLAGERLDFSKLATLTFEAPDYDKFTGLSLAMQAARIGNSMPTVFNAANERAVAKFLSGKIKFTEIMEIIEKCMTEHKVIKMPTIGQILDLEQSVYETIESRW